MVIVKKSLIRDHGSIIPDELLIEILVRLPEAKSVIRCKLVCRNWYGIISTTSFIRRFLNHNSAAAHDYGKLSHFVPQSHKLQSDYFPDFILPRNREEISRNNFSVIASCNDLLLCRLGSETEYCICNPLTKQYTTLPPSPKFIREEGRGFSYAIGFSCDPYVKKQNPDGQVTFNPDYTYRVVLVYNCFNFKRDGTRIHDFSSETNEWRVIIPEFGWGYDSNLLDCIQMWPMVFCKGMGFYIKRGPIIPQICIYNPQNNTLRAISGPREENRYFSCISHAALGVCRGFLRFLQLVASTRQEAEEVIITAKVWELDGDEQWRLVHLHQLGDLWHFGITNSPSSRRESDIYYKLSALATDPNDADIIYITVHKDNDISDIVSCNLREMEMKHIQGPFGPIVQDEKRFILPNLVFPVMASLWPTPIRLPIAR